MDLRPWMIPWDPYRCSEHGQQTITIQSDGWGGEQHFCTRDAWEYGWLTGRNPWPPTREPGWRDLPENRKKSRASSLRYFTGPPADTAGFACECLCSHSVRARWAEMSKEEGRLRCPACVEAGHDPVGGNATIGQAG